MKKFLYLPVETISRELSSKLWIASVAAQSNYISFVGSKSAINSKLKSSPRGIVLHKSLQVGFDQKLDETKAQGHLLAALCEEGLMFFSPADYCNRKLGERCLQLIDAFYCWGEVQRNAVLQIYPWAEAKCRITGNPRMDLAAIKQIYEAEAARIKAQFGDFVLLNTKFARINYVGATGDPNAWIEKQIAAGYCPDETQKRLMQGSVEQETMVLKGITAFIERYHTFGIGMPLVVRPHPGEEIGYWNALAERSPDVRVIREGDSAAWIMASRAVISNNCTSSVEATLLGRKTINYRPFVNEAAEYLLPRLLGKQAFDEAELVRELKSLGDVADPGDIEKLRPYFSLGPESSAQRLVEGFDALLEKNKLTDLNRVDPVERIGFFTRVLRYGNAKARAFYRAKLKPDQSVKSRRHKQKFPGISPDHLNHVRDQFIRSGLSNERVQFEWLSDGLVKVYSRP